MLREAYEMTGESSDVDLDDVLALPPDLMFSTPSSIGNSLHRRVRDSRCDPVQEAQSWARRSA